MRILFSVAHFFNPEGGGFYGSLKPDPKPRVGALTALLQGLHTCFGRRQGLLNPTARSVVPCNGEQTAEIEVVICTTGERHLVRHLPRGNGLFRHHATGASPMLLGFECHRVLADNLGKYDYYCYLEDDLLLADPWVFRKLEWFNGLAGDGAVLQPNRFEAAIDQPWHKLYIDGNLAKPEISARFQDVADQPVVSGEAFGQTVRFQRVNNPHAGCFFLNSRQMEYWASRPEFLDGETSFISPLESAATVGIMRCFRVYKPARENAGFFEIRHLDRRYLGVRLKFSSQSPERLGP